MTSIIRTTISLDEREYELAKEEAHAVGISVAEFVRRAVREALSPAADGGWMRFAGLVETGDSKASQSSTSWFMARRTGYVRADRVPRRPESHHALFGRLISQPPQLVTSALVEAEGHGWFLRRYDVQRGIQFLAFIAAGI